MTFSIGDENNNAVSLPRIGFFEAFNGAIKCLIEIGSTHGNDAGIEIVEHHSEGGIVAGGGALKECISGESDEADAVAIEFVYQIADAPFGLLKAGGFEVLGEHAFGGVEGDENVESALSNGFPFIAPLGASESK